MKIDESVIFMKDFNNVLEIIPLEKLNLEGEDSFKNLSIMAKLNYYSIDILFHPTLFIYSYNASVDFEEIDL